MADLTADEILRLKQALVSNDRDGTLTERVKETINAVTNACYGVTYTVGAEAGDVIGVACQFTNLDGDDMDSRVCVRQWLSDGTSGEVIEAAATTLAAGTDGAILVEETSNGIWMAVSEADGDLDIDIGNAGGADTLYLNTLLPNGKIVQSAAITFA